jgi:haloalkane dehalogenase
MSIPSQAEEIRPGVLRTPDSRFENLPDYDFEPNYVEIQGYRVHYVDEGPKDGEVILMLHGEPSWSYLYRKMIPIFVEAGYRAIAPDLIGFGRSDKPTSMDTHTYQFHVDTQTALVEALNLNDVTFVGQDWGGLIGLRVVAENENRFSRVAIANTGLPNPQADQVPSGAFMNWKRINQLMIFFEYIPTGAMISRNVGDPSLKEAYECSVSRFEL